MAGIFETMHNTVRNIERGCIEPGTDLNTIEKTGLYIAKESNAPSPVAEYASVEAINDALKKRKEHGQSNDDINDTFHTFGELYHHRAILFATIVNNPILKDLAWKSKQHDDPENPMYDGMFIVGINTPEGQATYHYDIEPFWDMFDVQELERAPKYDGHTPDDAIKRIASLWKLYVR